MNYYNENDPGAAAWLRLLIAEGVIAPGDVDERSITEIKAHELDGYSQCHFFAGVGGWSYAMRLAGWPDDEPVWTGSCPCQPFSAAGKRKVDEDERHLWPAFRGLIAERGPAICFGEQVASTDGRVWLAGIRADLEALGFGVGAADLCAAGVGSPNIRQRLFWMGLANGERRQRERLHVWSGRSHEDRVEVAGAGPHRGHRRESFWSRFDSVPCLDGKTRRVEPGSFPLVDGLPEYLGLLRGYGNAIVPQVAALFIQAATEAITL